LASIFTKIINGEIPCYKVAESDKCIAFLDVFPLKEGHVLVVPKMEVDYIFDLPDDVYSNLLQFSNQVAKAVKKAIPCKRISMHVIGLEVPHAHIHLIPINSMNDCDFSQNKLKFSKEEFLLTAQKITKAFQSI
jgi:histidine triad (HIT) family protein